MEAKGRTFFKAVRTVYAMISFTLILAAMMIVSVARGNLAFLVIAGLYVIFSLLAGIGAYFTKKDPPVGSSVTITYLAPASVLLVTSPILAGRDALAPVAALNIVVGILLGVLALMYTVRRR